MSLENPARLRLVRGFLIFAGLAWGVSAFGVFSTWNAAAQALQALGAKPITYDRMLDYWLRMAAGAFTLIGVGYFLLAISPQKHAPVLPWSGWLMILEGVVLMIHGLMLGLPLFPFHGDVTACFVGGGAILALQNCARQE